MEPMTRGYALPLAARFVLDDPELKPLLTPEDVTYLTEVAHKKPEVWVPRADVVRLWSIAADRSVDEDHAYRSLVRGGEAVAREAISTFLKFLLRVLSPKLFARKFPDIWSHEHKGGRVEAIVNANTMVIIIHDVGDFAHVGPVAVGFVGTALRALGLKDLQIKDVTWTRENPAPLTARLEMSWA